MQTAIQINDELVNGLSIDSKNIINKISLDLNIQAGNVFNTVELLKEDNTIPFISRYRKEKIGFLNEEQVRDISHKLIFFENLEERKITILKAIHEQGKLTEELFLNIMKSNSLVEIEDIYAPYKRKKKTRAMIAIEKGLEPLADLMTQLKDLEIEMEAEKFINAEKGVNSKEEALEGAKDIIAEKIAHDIDKRTVIKDFILNDGYLACVGQKEADTSVYKTYYDFKGSFKSLKPHQILAINRGETEEELRVVIDFEDDKCNQLFLSKFRIVNNYQKLAIEDGLKRLLLPAVIREVRGIYTDDADTHGIDVFSKNLRALLMQPPIKKTRVLGVDPGIRTGSKCAALDDTGKYLGYFVIFQHIANDAKRSIADAVKKYQVEVIAVGNGTGSHEVQAIVSEAIKDYGLSVQYTVVSEDGASVYSASDIARDEFPELDLTIRGAISIARRLQDPLAELVKIDPKSIGVGLYQHDVNQTKLSEAVDEVVESVVNQVGVNINTASYSLLKYVSGISTMIAKSIVEYRNTHGIIKGRDELKNVSGLGEKTFEQAAGFLKIPESVNPLDNTWVHPENYEVATEVLKLLKLNNKVSQKDKENLLNKYGVSNAVIDDIMEELKKPNRDPRADYPQPIMQKDVVTFEDLKVGMKVTGKIKNVVDFGAFVDIGIKESALLHISQMSDTFVKNPHSILKVGDIKEFSIIEIDAARKRIALSLKTGARFSSMMVK